LLADGATIYIDGLFHHMCSASYNYYGSSHLQQFPHYACDCDFFQVPGPSSRTEKSKAWEPSTAAIDDEDCRIAGQFEADLMVHAILYAGRSEPQNLVEVLTSTE